MRFTTIKWGILLTIFRVTESKQTEQTRIVKGTSTTIEKHPYMVQIMIHGMHCCGGSIITSYWILTAGHCTAEYSPYKPIKYKLIVGSTYSGHGSMHDVVMVVVHELYNRNHDLYADIAMMKAKTNFVFSDKVAKINIPMSAGSYKHCIIAGWGTTMDTADRTVLQELEMHTISMQECGEFYTPFRSNICVRAYAEGAAPCFGDSGGPLVCDGVVAGLLSYGSRNCDRQQPEVYTSVAAFYSWVRDVLRKDGARIRAHYKWE